MSFDSYVESPTSCYIVTMFVVLHSENVFGDYSYCTGDSRLDNLVTRALQPQASIVFYNSPKEVN